MEELKDFLIVTIIVAILVVGFTIGIRKTEPSAASENANRFILEQVMYNRRAYLVTDTKTVQNILLLVTVAL